MKNQSILYGVIGLLAGSLVTVLLLTNIVNNNNSSMMQMMGIRRSGSTTPIVNNIDRHFIEQMIPHHEGAIEMAKLALERSTRSEIKTLATDIVQSQSAEIDNMKAWYKDWYGTDVPVDPEIGMGMGRGMMHGGMMSDEVADVESLQKATDFDEAFLQEMIPHHQMAVMMSNMLLQSTNRSEMKQLAQNIIVAQEKEIDQMRLWLADWNPEGN